MVNASKKAGLGRTLGRAQKLANERRNPRKSNRHTVETNPNQDNARLNLRSVTAQTNLDQFFEEAELAGKQFITERRNVAILNEDDTQTCLYDQFERLDNPPPELNEEDIAASLCVPRRPLWTQDTTPEQLDELEKLSFLAWRKKLAKIQENDTLILTPFEKNIEVWRQLWRVIERSDIIVQILDARNPLLYLCDDLIKYVQEGFYGSKANMILLNKADYLTLEQRKLWCKYFKARGIKAIFFSALIENENLKKSTNQTSEAENETHSESENRDSNGADEEEEFDIKVADKLKENLNLNTEDIEDEEAQIYDKFKLLDHWHDELVKLRGTKPVQTMKTSRSDEENPEQQNKSRPMTVGLVGYPNVGKSSTINALLSAKRVAVSATPGKTKHFQTFFIDEDMMLCDCPGLVFPNFVSSKSEMVVNGILPIDQMKDCIGPVRIIVDRIPRAYFEEIYGLAFEVDSKQNIIAEDLLNSFGFMRGYMTARGLPDVSRAARRICKDYINGKILYCEPPPDADKRQYHKLSKLADAMKQIEERRSDPNFALRITERQKRLMAQAKGNGITVKDFDAQLSQPSSGGAHIRGLPGIGNMTQPIGQHGEVRVLKREKRHKKKEKLRRVYRDLDI